MFSPIRKPLLLHYYVTTSCNCRCSFCDIPGPDAATARLEEVAANLEGARRLGARFVDFTGGEPLLFKALPDALRKARSLGMITSVTTNGILLGQRARELSGLIRLPRLSLDGTEATHNAIRGRDCYAAALEGLRACRGWPVRPDILFTLTPENRDDIGHVHEIARKHGTILILDPVFSYFANPDFGTLDALLRRWVRKPGVYVNTAFLRLRRAGGNHIDSPVCRAGDAVIVVSPNNELLTPCFHKQQGAFPILEPLDELWNRSDVREARKEQGLLGPCEGCAINCYMDPSFCYRLDRYFAWSLLPKIRYAVGKFLLQRKAPSC